LLPAGAVAGWDLHPLESAAFPRRTGEADVDRSSLLANRDANDPAAEVAKGLGRLAMQLGSSEYTGILFDLITRRTTLKFSEAFLSGVIQCRSCADPPAHRI
jgi:hypothetical protein